jgi:hypothetical protein
MEKLRELGGEALPVHSILANDRQEELEVAYVAERERRRRR